MEFSFLFPIYEAINQRLICGIFVRWHDNQSGMWIYFMFIGVGLDYNLASELLAITASNFQRHIIVHPFRLFVVSKSVTKVIALMCILIENGEIIFASNCLSKTKANLELCFEGSKTNRINKRQLF